MICMRESGTETAEMMGISAPERSRLGLFWIGDSIVILGLGHSWEGDGFGDMSWE